MAAYRDLQYKLKWGSRVKSKGELPSSIWLLLRLQILPECSFLFSTPLKIVCVVCGDCHFSCYTSRSCCLLSQRWFPAPPKAQVANSGMRAVLPLGACTWHSRVLIPVVAQQSYWHNTKIFHFGPAVLGRLSSPADWAWLHRANDLQMRFLSLASFTCISCTFKSCAKVSLSLRDCLTPSAYNGAAGTEKWSFPPLAHLPGVLAELSQNEFVLHEFWWQHSLLQTLFTHVQKGRWLQFKCEALPLAL